MTGSEMSLESREFGLDPLAGVCLCLCLDFS